MCGVALNQTFRVNNFSAANYYSIHCPPFVFVTKFIFLNSMDIFGGECPKFVRCWLATRIPRMFRFWKDCTYSDCTYSAPRGATNKDENLNQLFSGCGETLLDLRQVPEGKSSLIFGIQRICGFVSYLSGFKRQVSEIFN